MNRALCALPLWCHRWSSGTTWAPTWEARTDVDREAMNDALDATTETERLQLIGYWAINGPWASLREPVGWPHPQKLVGTKWQAGLKQKIASYLRSGHVVMRCLGYSSCRLPSTRAVLLTTSSVA